MPEVTRSRYKSSESLFILVFKYGVTSPKEMGKLILILPRKEKALNSETE